MDNYYYKLTAFRKPLSYDGGEGFDSLKLVGPCVGTEPVLGATQYGIWWTPGETKEKIVERISEMVFAVIKEFKEEGDEGIA
jgi:hypothetical protein